MSITDSGEIQRWELYASSSLALQALIADGSAQHNTKGVSELAAPHYLRARLDSGVLCLSYERNAWVSRFDELLFLIGLLPTQYQTNRVLIEFDAGESALSTAGLACLLALSRSLNNSAGRLGMCGVSSELEYHLRVHTGNHIELRRVA